MRNSTLNSLDEVFDIIKRPPEQKSIKALPSDLQFEFKILCMSFLNPYNENEYKNALKHFRENALKKIKKVNWVMKTKLSSE